MPVGLLGRSYEKGVQMDQEPGDAGQSPSILTLLERPHGVLVRCAVCECDQALVPSHADADRVLTRHLGDCPGPASPVDR